MLPADHILRRITTICGFGRAIIRTNVDTKFHEDSTLNATSIENYLTNWCHVSIIKANVLTSYEHFRNLNAKCDGKTDRRTDRRTDGQSDHYIPPFLRKGGIKSLRSR
ncbi:hypothetical protein DPMN_094526 [Dreissena polymorpha]|uniref:Uncharacterized protein n=1 Tax=Dreissena polymorpha TaxID=45954 RepID=A0A9D4L6A5_DREPO|nr:hypothetical protein DPMN_094526 [Dreissena polymorpha]